MTNERWLDLMEPNSTAGLAPKEMQEGWHFCPEFDGCLLKIGDPGCDCEPWTKAEINSQSNKL